MAFSGDNYGFHNELDEDIHPEFVGEKNIPFDEKFFREFIDTSEQFMLDRMHASFGRYMVGHSRRSAFFQEQLLVAMGMEPEIARKVGMLMIPHDLGKAHRDLKDLYVLTVEKPLKDSFTEDQKKLHPVYGPGMTDVVLQIMGTSRKELDTPKRIWLTVSDYQQKVHHKPFDPRAGLIQRCSSVADSIDGQLKTVDQTPLDQLSAEDLMVQRDKAIEKLMTPKFAGKYDPDILLKAKEVNWALKPAISATTTLEMPPIS